MQIAPSTPDSITPWLRPGQVDEAKRDIAAAEAKLANPAIEDKDEVRRQLIRLKKNFNEQVPKPVASPDEEGRLHSRSKELLDHIVADGMLTQAEMRAAPPGAPDRHLAWERRNKNFILEWKKIQGRLKPGEREAANLELHRPVTGGALNLDTVVVPRKAFFGVDQVTGVAVTFSDEELIALEAISPEDRAQVPSMSNDARLVWKKTIALLMDKPKANSKKAA